VRLIPQASPSKATARQLYTDFRGFYTIMVTEHVFTCTVWIQITVVILSTLPGISGSI